MDLGIAIEHVERGGHISPVVIERCVNLAALKHGYDPTLQLAILDVEGGRKGAVSYNKSNGSFDLGPGQINTIQFEERWFKREYPNVTWQELAQNTCLNLEVSGRILKARIDELKPNKSIWNAVGNYHSKTYKYKLIYLQKVMKAYRARAERNGNGYNIAWN